jgi:hypothetical protein
MRGAALVVAAFVFCGGGACGGKSLLGGRDAAVSPGDAPDDADRASPGDVADRAGDADAPDADADAADTVDGGDADAVAPGFFVEPPDVDCRGYGDLSTCVVRVKPGGGAATGSPPGLTWATALGEPQAAFDLALCGCDVWLAGGTYRPTRSLDHPGDEPDPRNRSFVVWPGSTVLGGFAGDETSPSARATDGPETILSGDLGAPGDRSDNAYHVVVGADGASLDGLTVRDGFANGFGLGQGEGAGIINAGASMSLRNVRVTDNEASTGGGIYNDKFSRTTLVGCTLARNTADVGGAIITNANSTIDHCSFLDNVGVFQGGAIAQFGGTLELTDSRFFRNRSDTGGGVVFGAGESHLARCWFETNIAGSFGAAFVVRTSATVRAATSAFVSNFSVGYGGALALWTGNLALESATIVGNHAAFGGGFLVKDGSRLTLADSVAWNNPDDAGRAVYLDGVDNEITATTSDVPAAIGGVTTFDADPKLGNVPVGTRLAQSLGTTSTVLVTGASKFLIAGDRIELGDDGVERRVTFVDAVDDLTVTFAPPWPAATPRYLRVDLWAATAPSLTLDLTPTAASPLVDAASSGAPPEDIFGHARVGVADLGAVEFVPR